MVGCVFERRKTLRYEVHKGFKAIDGGLKEYFRKINLKE